MNTRLSYKEIEEKLGEAEKTFLKTHEKASDSPVDYFLENGYFTHSFNGNKFKRINKYGLCYSKKLSREEADEINENRRNLNELERLLGTSEFIDEDSDKLDQTFITLPGTKTIHYALNNSPERLYLGPLFQLNPIPIVLGETKENYMNRVLKQKIKDKYIDDESDEYKKLMSIAKKVTKFYVSSNPCFALIKAKDIKNLNFNIGNYYEEVKAFVQTLETRVKNNAFAIGSYFDYFSSKLDDSSETNNLDDLSTLEDIPRSSFDIVKLMDAFEIKQLYAYTKGCKIGDEIDYDTCEKINRPRIYDLYNVIDNAKTLEELDEIENKYNAYKEGILRKIKLFRDINSQDIDKKLIKLNNKKEEIYDREFYYSGVKYESLRMAVTRLKNNNTFDRFLELDNEVLNDKLQYDSFLHGTNHTRRVMFNLFLMMDLFKYNLNDRDKEILIKAARYHDIGRVNDDEDKTHGHRSVQILKKTKLLSDFTEKEKEAIYFIIEEHSLSKKENIEDLSSLSYDKSKKYELLLNILKDADRLDRVRLSRNTFDGLDPDRLSYNLSTHLETVSYESYEKLFEILKIEKEERFLKEAQNTYKENEIMKEFESKLLQRRNEIKSNSRNFLNSVRDKVKSAFENFTFLGEDNGRSL